MLSIRSYLVYSFLFVSLFLPSNLPARTPTWDGWNFDIVQIKEDPTALSVYVKNTSNVHSKVGKVRVNVVINGREVDSRYLDVTKGEVSIAEFTLPQVTGIHSVSFQVWGGWSYGWKFDETPPKQISFGASIEPPRWPFEIKSRESGPFTIYSCKFSEKVVNKMADDWFAADEYARKIAWRMINDKFAMSKEIIIALAVTIKATADNLQYQSQQNRNCVLVYELNFDNRTVPVVQTLQAVSAAVDFMHIVFTASTMVWHPVSSMKFIQIR